MNITKEQADKVIAALEDSRSQVVVYGQDYHPGLESVVLEDIDEALTIMRGLEDAAPVCNHEWFQTGAMLSNEKRCIQCGEWGKLYTSPQAAQTEAHGLESLFSEWFDSTPHGEPSPRETFEAGYQAGRAGSKP